MHKMKKRNVLWKKNRFKKMVLAQMISWGKYPLSRDVKICLEKSKTIIANFNAWDENCSH